MCAHKFLRFVVCVLVIGLVSSPALAQYDVYKNSQDGTKIPDVNKAGVPPPPGAAPGDKSCWQATAANILAGAGWGLAANNAQQNGNAIYGHMTGHFTTANPGQAALAINWWLYNYGYNPAQAVNGWYRPELKYNDITDFVGGPLTSADNDYLLNELQNCKYVGVTWVLGGTSSGDHCMTLVGGNKSINAVATSVWHDSDNDNPGPDDPYANNFAIPTGQWSLPAYPTVQATGYVTLGTGLQKPDDAMDNYDAAYYKDQSPAGDVSKVWRVAGTAPYGQPMWQQDSLDDYTILQVPNESIQEMQKEVYLLVDYNARNYDPNHPELAPDIILQDELGNIVTDRLVEVSQDGGQVKYTWTIDHQPPWEQIIFPTEDYYFLSGDIMSFNVATICVPEPAAIVLLAIGVLTMLLHWRRRG